MEISVWVTTAEENRERNLENVSVIIYDFMCENYYELNIH